MSGVLWLLPELSFTAMVERLKEAGWQRTALAPLTPPLRAGEPEFASFARGKGRLDYAYDPVTDLRSLRAADIHAAAELDALARALPCAGQAEREQALLSSEPQGLLRGIRWALAARDVFALPRLQMLAAHPEPAVAQAAAQARPSLLEAAAVEAEPGSETQATHLRAFADCATGLLALLPGADDATLLDLAPTEQECRQVFDVSIAARVHAAYAALWRSTPPKLRPGAARSELSVWACTALMFRGSAVGADTFPAGYRGIAELLSPARAWLAWRYHRPGEPAGLAANGLVFVGARWVWFPKPYALLQSLASWH